MFFFLGQSPLLDLDSTGGVTFDGLKNLLQLHRLLRCLLNPRASAILFLRIAANGHHYCGGSERPPGFYFHPA